MGVDKRVSCRPQCSTGAFMIQISQFKISVEEDSMETIQQKLAHMCGVATTELSDITILKRSVDARKKPEVWMVYALAFLAGKKEGEILKRLQKRAPDVTMIPS